VGETFFSRLDFASELSEATVKLSKLQYHEGGTVRAFDNTKLMELDLQKWKHSPTYVEDAYKKCRCVMYIAKPVEVEQNDLCSNSVTKDVEHAETSAKKLCVEQKLVNGQKSIAARPMNSPVSPEAGFWRKSQRRQQQCLGSIMHRISQELLRLGKHSITCEPIANSSSPVYASAAHMFRPVCALKSVFPNDNFDGDLRAITFVEAGVCAAGMILKCHRDPSFIEIQYLVVSKAVSEARADLYRDALVYVASTAARLWEREHIVAHALSHGVNAVENYCHIGFEKMTKARADTLLPSTQFKNTQLMWLPNVRQLTKLLLKSLESLIRS